MANLREEYLREEREFFRDIYLSLTTLLVAIGVIALIGWLV